MSCLLRPFGGAAIVLAALLTACGGGSSDSWEASCGEAASSARATGLAQPGPSPVDDHALRGVFVVIDLLNPAKARCDAIAAVATRGVTGLAIDLQWNQIAGPAKDTYDFSALDTILGIAKGAGKKAQLSVVAADGTPSAWFAAASLLHLQYAPQGGRLERCYDTRSPPPWDQVFLASWDMMVERLAQFVDSGGYADTVVALRLTGLNTHSAETHVPTQSLPWSDAAQQPDCFTIDNPTAWQSSGYTPTRLKEAWIAMVASWAKHFPVQTFSLALIEGRRYPPIDDSGSIVPWKASADAALNDALIGIAAQALPGRLVLAKFFLISDQPADPTTVGYALQYAVPTSWQTNLWWVARARDGAQPGAAACGGSVTEPDDPPEPCTSGLFLQMLQRGVEPILSTTLLPTRTVEVFMPDATLYADAILQVDCQLHDPSATCTP